MVTIMSVIPDSAAEKCGIITGDILVKINDHPINDVLDYMFYSAEQNLRIEILRDSDIIFADAVKNEYDDLGLEFETFLMDCKQTCRNKCVFCFIDQMPPGMRETLYFKDDDARLSFLQGNYVTLTNLEQKDIDRIINMKLNINVSVHTTNPELRVRMMNNRFAGEKLDYIRQLAESGIMLNCQIVCCPGLNDGDELRRSLRDLGQFMPNISSIAVVPVGLSRFREGLYPLTSFTKETAGDTIDIIEEFQAEFLENFGTRTVFPSDEFYLIAERELPSSESYEDYPQYENGVGMLRSLIEEFEDALESTEYNGQKRNISVATGYSAFETINKLAKMAEARFTGLRCRVYPIRNDFFGETITVSGLITGQDLIAQLSGKELGDELLISSSMLRSGSDVFLDDLTVSDVRQKLDVIVTASDNNGYDLLDAILGYKQKGDVQYGNTDSCSGRTS